MVRLSDPLPVEEGLEPIDFDEDVWEDEGGAPVDDDDVAADDFDPEWPVEDAL